MRTLKGVTLTEMIIATAVVGVVAVGVVSTEQALRRHNETASSSAQASAGAQSIVSHIAKNSFKAVGSNPVIDTSASQKSIRLAGGNFVNYTLIGNDLYTCTGVAAAACTNADTLLGPAGSTQSYGISYNSSSNIIEATATVLDANAPAAPAVARMTVNPPNVLAVDPGCVLACVWPEVCFNGSCCTQTCVVGNECGSDGCGGVCGTCTPPEVCSFGGQCIELGN